MKAKKILFGGMRMARSKLVRRSAVLLYHRVAEPVDDQFKLCVSPSNFEEQMSAIAASGRAVSLPEMVRKSKGGNSPHGALAVTFDDGYLDNLRTALPILEHHRIPATIFVVTGNLGGRFWWDRLEEILKSCPEPPDEIQVGTADRPLSIRFNGRSIDELYPIFRSLDQESREQAISEFAAQLGVAEAKVEDGRRALSVDELRELGSHPLITIGAHTVSHGQLSALSPEEQRREICGSKEELEKILGRPVTTFSYPFGLRGRDFSDESMRLAKGAGLECALAADSDVVTRWSDPFALPRLWVHNRDRKGFMRAIGRWIRWSSYHEPDSSVASKDSKALA